MHDVPDGKIHNQSEMLNVCICSELDPSIAEILNTIPTQDSMFKVFNECTENATRESLNEVSTL